MFLRTLLLLLLSRRCTAVTDIAAGATEDSVFAGTCLTDAVPFQSRRFLSVESVEMPVGFWVMDWASAELAAEVAMLVLREAMGVHTSATGLSSSSTTALYAMAGCANPEEHASEEGRACSIASHARNPHHAALEIWGIEKKLPVMQERLAPIVSVMPTDAGAMGYVGSEGMYVFEEQRQSALRSTGLPLEYYRCWDTQWFSPWRYFSKMSDVDPSMLLPCQDVARFNDPTDAANYLRHTGDAEGLEFDSSTDEPLGAKCWNGTWWLSPACRDNFSKCVVSITGGGGWLAPTTMQRATLHNMPIAIGTAKSSALWREVGRGVSGAHYWYTPDITFVDLKPSLVIFPPFDAEEKSNNKLDSADVDSPLGKFLWNKLSSVAPHVQKFLLNFDLSEKAINSLLIDAALNSSDSYEAVACRWVRSNRAVWEAWIPSDTQCAAGMGLVNSSGGFVSALEDGATGCSFCPPGRYSSELSATAAAAATRICELCEPGSSQEAPLQVECQNCLPGQFAAREGQDACKVCPEASFQPEGGSSACVACPAPAVTRLLGATSAEQCVCPTGTYQPYLQHSQNSSGTNSGSRSSSCATCPAGMECQIDSREQWIPATAAAAASLTPEDPSAAKNYPSVLVGHMSIAAQPLTVYKCAETGYCPGGLPGTCAPHRNAESVACAACASGRFEAASGNCRECQGWQTIVMLILAPIAILAAMVLLAWSSNKERIAEANASATCAIVAGLTCTSIQTISILQSIEVKWMEPLQSAINAVSLLGFDIKIIGAGCLFDGGAGTFILRQLVAPLLAAWLLLIALLRKRLNLQPHLELSVHFANSAGSLCMLVFISIVLSGVMPLICYRHPGEAGESMTTAPEVLCFDSHVHWTMVAAGMAGLTCVPVPFFVLILWATLRYPSFVRMSQMSNGLQLRRLMFLFRRFEPHGYFYGALLLTRGLLICLVPVIFRDNVPANLLLLAAILMFFVTVQNIIRPWRGSLANALDTIINGLIILVLFCGALSHTDAQYLESTISAFAHLCLILFLLVLAVSFTVALVQYTRPSPYYHRFVCHHKADAAAQARFLQLLLQSQSGKTCFIDSDDLLNLDDLFDTVRVRVGLLIVYLTASTLRRPWCAGEITTACKARVRATRVVTPSFVTPSDGNISDPIDSGYMDPIGKEFTEAGLIERDLAAALKWVLSDAVPAIHIDAAKIGTHRLMEVTQEILKDSHPPSSLPRVASAQQPGSGSILLSSEVGNDEATAVVGILAILLREWAISKTGMMTYALCDMPDLQTGKLSLPELQSCFRRSFAAIVVLSAGSLTSKQLSSIVIATEVSEQRGGSYDVIHASTSDFQFPTSDFYKFTMPSILEQGVDCAHAQSLLQTFFRKISVRVTPSASRQILETEAQEIRKRMTREAKATDMAVAIPGSTSTLLTSRSPSPDHGVVAARSESPLEGQLERQPSDTKPSEVDTDDGAPIGGYTANADIPNPQTEITCVDSDQAEASTEYYSPVVPHDVQDLVIEASIARIRLTL